MKFFVAAVVLTLAFPVQAGLFFGSNHRTTVVHQYGPAAAPPVMLGAPAAVSKVRVKHKHGKRKSTTTTYSIGPR